MLPPLYEIPVTKHNVQGTFDMKQN